MEAGGVVSVGTPDEISRDPRALAAYLGASAEALTPSGTAAVSNGARPRRCQRGRARTWLIDEWERSRAFAEGGGHGFVFDRTRTSRNRRTPLGIGRRAARRFGHRSRPTQLRTLAAVMAVLCGLGAYLAAAPASTPGIGVAGAASNNSLSASLRRASTSTRGIVGNKINVVFPVVSLNSLAGKEGFAEDYEFSEQTKAIKFFVGLVNQEGDPRQEDQPHHRHLTTRPTRRACAPCARTGRREVRLPSP